MYKRPKVDDCLLWQDAERIRQCLEGRRFQLVRECMMQRIAKRDGVEGTELAHSILSPEFCGGEHEVRLGYFKEHDFFFRKLLLKFPSRQKEGSWINSIAQQYEWGITKQQAYEYCKYFYNL